MGRQKGIIDQCRVYALDHDQKDGQEKPWCNENERRVWEKATYDLTQKSAALHPPSILTAASELFSEICANFAVVSGQGTESRAKGNHSRCKAVGRRMNCSVTGEIEEQINFC